MEIEDGNIGHVKIVNEIITKMGICWKNPYSIYFVMTILLCMAILTGNAEIVIGYTPQALNSLNGSKRTMKWTCRHKSWETHLSQPQNAELWHVAEIWSCKIQTNPWHFQQSHFSKISPASVSIDQRTSFKSERWTSGKVCSCNSSKASPGNGSTVGFVVFLGGEYLALAKGTWSYNYFIDLNSYNLSSSVVQLSRSPLGLDRIAVLGVQKSPCLP